MPHARIASFREFWPYYVRQHGRPATRLLHLAGLMAAVAVMATALMLQQAKLLVGAPVLAYGVSWLSHLFIEKNRPASFGYPLWSICADLKMAGMMLTGAMTEEARRVLSAE